MNQRKVFLKGLVFFFGLLFVAVVWMSVRALVPVDPAIPYFLDNHGRIPVVKWVIGTFQPVYLYSYSKDGLGYIKAVYRDNKGTIQLIDIYTGGKENGGWAGLIKPEDEYLKVQDGSEYGKNLGFGQRMRVTYLRDVSGTLERNYGQTELNNKIISNGEICRVIPNVCISYEAVLADQEAFLNFKDTGIQPQKTALPVLDVFTYAINK